MTWRRGPIPIRRGAPQSANIATARAALAEAMKITTLDGKDLIRLEEVARAVVEAPGDATRADFAANFGPVTVLRLFMTMRAMHSGVWQRPARHGLRPLGREDGDTCAACGGDRRADVHGQVRHIAYHAFKRRPR